MKSLSLFYNIREKKTIIEKLFCSKDNHNQLFEVHINLWNTRIKVNENYLCKKHTLFRAIDFGIKCSIDVQSLKLLLPFKVTTEDFQDLAMILSENKELLCTVFNTNMRICSTPTLGFHTITDLEKKRTNTNDNRFLMYELSKKNISLSNFDSETGYTILTITLQYKKENLPNDHPSIIYIRFRILLHDLKAFAIQHPLSNDFLQSAFSSTHLFDIRLNDVRETCKKLKESVEFEGYKFAEFSKVHFFYMANIDEILENGSLISLDTRMLEIARWKPYIKNKELSNECIAYHWKKDKKDKALSKFNLFFKTNYSDLQLLRIMLYIGIAILIGIISSSIVTALSNTLLIKNDPLRCLVMAFSCIILLLAPIIYKLWRKSY